MRLINAEELKVSIAEKIKVDSYEKDDVINGVLQIISDSPTVQPFDEKIISELQAEKTSLLSFIKGIDYALSVISGTINAIEVMDDEIN